MENIYRGHPWLRPLGAALVALAVVAAPVAVGWGRDAGKLTELPAEKSARPGPADWKGAAAVELAAVSPAASRCKAFVMREWLKVRCVGGTTSAVTQLGGERDGVALWIDPPTDKAANLPGDAEVIFPLRRGDRRVIQFWTFGPGYDGPLTVVPAFTLHEEWIDLDAPGPTLLLL